MRRFNGARDLFNGSVNDRENEMCKSTVDTSTMQCQCDKDKPPVDSLVIPFLSLAEVERLALLAEECGEVIQAVGKILRHGYESRHPDGGPTNRELLERECGDVLAALDLLAAGQYAGKDIDSGRIQAARQVKHSKIGRYLHHQG